MEKCLSVSFFFVSFHEMHPPEIVDTNSITLFTLFHVIFKTKRLRRHVCVPYLPFVITFFRDNRIKDWNCRELEKRKLIFMWSHVITETCFSHWKRQRELKWNIRKNLCIIYAWTIILLTHPTAVNNNVLQLCLYVKFNANLLFVRFVHWNILNKQHTQTSTNGFKNMAVCFVWIVWLNLFCHLIHDCTLSPFAFLYNTDRWLYYNCN